MFKFCSFCGNEFETNSHRQMFCSELCSIQTKASEPDANNCQNWTGATSWNGYGMFTYNGERKRVARTVLSQKLNRELGHDEVTRHTCDNRLCCNPDHLEIGSQQDNIADMVTRQRQARGSMQGNARLTEDEVREIRGSNLGTSELARMYDVTPANISCILHRKTWKHI